MMLHVRVSSLPLRIQVFQRKLIGRFGRSEKRRRVVRYEASLPSFPQVLAGVSDKVSLGNKGSFEADQVGYCCAHSYRVPPRSVHSNAGIGQIAGQHKHSLRRTGRVSRSAWSGGVDEQDGPLGAAGTRGEYFRSIEYISCINFLYSGPKLDRFARGSGLRLAAPGDPFFTTLHYALEPQCFLSTVSDSIQQNHRIGMSLPASRQ